MVSREEVLEVLKNVEDPELAFNIVDLGLVYRVDVKEDAIEVDFTLTYPGCPAEDIIREDIEPPASRRVRAGDVKTTTVWSPLWGPERMSEEARVTLGYPI